MFKQRLPVLILSALVLSSSLSLSEKPAIAAEASAFKAPGKFYNPAIAADLAAIEAGSAQKDPYFQALKAMHILGLSENPHLEAGSGHTVRLSPEASREARDLVQAASATGHPLGLFLACRLNREERFTRFDEALALDVCKRAVPGLEQLAAQHDVYASFALGYIDRYAAYQGVVFSRMGDAESDFLAAAKQGHVDAQYQLGLYYAQHSLFSDAQAWFEKAAESGNPIAEAVYGSYLADVFEDPAKAEVYLLRAVAQQDPLGLTNLERLYYTTDRAAKIPELHKIGAESGYVEFMTAWGLDLLYGEQVPANQAEGIAWLERVAENLSPQAALTGQLRLADLYYEGSILKRDFAKAMSWYQRAAREGNAPLALLRIGEMYLDGQGVVKNPAEAFKWFNQAGEMEIDQFELIDFSDILKLHLHLSRMYAQGIGVTADEAKAVSILRKLSPYSDEAQYQLGIRFRDGKGLPRSRSNALYWLTQAAKSNHAEAVKALKALRLEPRSN